MESQREKRSQAQSLTDIPLLTLSVGDWIGFVSKRHSGVVSGIIEYGIL
jgi:hypothetical protein